MVQLFISMVTSHGEAKKLSASIMRRIFPGRDRNCPQYQPQAVYDTLRRSETLLEEWEDKLGLLQRQQSWSKAMNQLSMLLERLQERVAGDQEALALIEEIKGLVGPFQDNRGKGGEKC